MLVYVDFVLHFVVKMYNGIGLSTVRGSGTNGYVQRNLAHVSHLKERVNYASEADMTAGERMINRKPNKEILEHEKKRRVEVKCAEMRENMEEQG